MFSWYMYLLLMFLMMSGISCDICGRGHLKIDGACFMFGPSGTKYWEASQYCKDQNANLARIDTQEKHDALNEYMSKKFPGDEFFWIDLKKSGDGFIHRSNGKPVNKTFWLPEQPSNHNNEENCVAKVRNGWDDLKCDWRISSICESSECPSCSGSGEVQATLDVEVDECNNGAKRIGDACFVIESSKSVTQEEAKKDCESKSGRLARMTTEEKYQRLEKYLKVKTFVNWIIYWVRGMREGPDEDDFFDDGVQLTDTRWADNEPNNHNENEGCITQRYQLNDKEFRWNDVYCDSHAAYICELTECPTDCNGKPDKETTKATNDDPIKKDTQTAPTIQNSSSETPVIPEKDTDREAQDTSSKDTSLKSSILSNVTDTSSKSAGPSVQYGITVMASVLAMTWICTKT